MHIKYKREETVKLTPDVKKEIDKMSPHQIYTMFRFHPTDITSGESGRYMQQSIHRKREEYTKKELAGEQKPKVFGAS